MAAKKAEVKETNHQKLVKGGIIKSEAKLNDTQHAALEKLNATEVKSMISARGKLKEAFAKKKIAFGFTD